MPGSLEKFNDLFNISFLVMDQNFGSGTQLFLYNVKCTSKKNFAVGKIANQK